MMAPLPEDVVEHLITFVPASESWSVIIDRFFFKVGKALGEIAAWTPLRTRVVLRPNQLLTLDEDDDLLYFF